MKDGTTYDVAYYTAATTAVLTNGETVTYDKSQIDHYEVKGLKYVPVKVSEDDYENFCKKYVVVENGGTLSGGFSENKLTELYRPGCRCNRKHKRSEDSSEKCRWKLLLLCKNNRK